VLVLVLVLVVHSATDTPVHTTPGGMEVPLPRPSTRPCGQGDSETPEGERGSADASRRRFKPWGSVTEDDDDGDGEDDDEDEDD